MRAILCCAALISGCATLDARVAVPVSCLSSDPPAMPQTTDEAALLRLDEYQATLLIWTERLELKAFSLKASSLLQACK